MTSIPFSPTTAETEASLRRVALVAAGIASILASVVTVIALRFAAFGIGHQDVPFVERLQTLLGW
jgi:hypothetical protein